MPLAPRIFEMINVQLYHKGHVAKIITCEFSAIVYGPFSITVMAGDSNGIYEVELKK